MHWKFPGYCFLILFQLFLALGVNHRYELFYAFILYEYTQNIYIVHFAHFKTLYKQLNCVNCLFHSTMFFYRYAHNNVCGSDFHFVFFCKSHAKSMKGLRFLYDLQTHKSACGSFRVAETLESWVRNKGRCQSEQQQRPEYLTCSLVAQGSANPRTHRAVQGGPGASYTGRACVTGVEHRTQGTRCFLLDSKRA